MAKSAIVPRPSKAITLHPLKAVGNLRERYPEATADVAFVGKERLPAHRAVLSVSSSVFFKMFDGDWRESREKNIPAPTEYSWEAFKAAITLLYGVEVEVDESSILDVYKVAHCYDLGYVKVVLAHAISQWDTDMAATAFVLCALTGRLETEDDQKGHELIQAGSTYIAKHLALIYAVAKAESTLLNALPYEAMLKIVQSEDITVPELDVFEWLSLWVCAKADITLRQARILYSHIRYGFIPKEILCLAICQENLALTMQNHEQLSLQRMKNNLKQITPRLCQREVLQVYPLVAGLSVLRKMGKWEFVDVMDPTNYTVGVIFSGRHELSFRLSLKMVADQSSQLCVELSSICAESYATKAKAKINLFEQFHFGGNQSVSLSFLEYSITLKSTGAFLVPESRQGCLPKDKRVCKYEDLPFKGTFPWVLKIGVPHKSVSMTLYC